MPESSLLAAREERISNDKRAKYRGSAQVSIEHLDFPHPCRHIDTNVIEQLIRDFEGEGCIKDTNRIPAIIDDSVLHAGLKKLAMSAESFKAVSNSVPPRLDLERDVRIECLHGQHRILAAKKFLKSPKRWWIVDFYSSDLEVDTKQALREGEFYSEPYASGEIFRNFRLCCYNKDDLGAQRWRNRLKPYQEKYLNIILKRETLIKALDSVLNISGLWRSFYAGSLNDFISLGCDEEIARFIKAIKTEFTRIFGNNMVIMMATDPSSIESIQSRAPALSKSDFKFIDEGMRSGELFPAVADPVTRENIAEGLLSTEMPIQSLWTLLCDIRYLKKPARLLNVLLPSRKERKIKNSLYERFRVSFTESTSNDFEVQQSTLSYKPLSGNLVDHFDAAYQQLWLCACRVWKYPNVYGLIQLATLAHQLGFSTTEIKHERAKDPGHIIIERAFREGHSVLRPGEKFSFDPNQAISLIRLFNEKMDETLGSSPIALYPFITVAGPAEPLSRRCGNSSKDTEDLGHLFLDKIHAPLQDYQRAGDEISSFYVKRSRHIAFFGTLALENNPQNTSTRVLSANPPQTQDTSGMISSHAGSPIEESRYSDEGSSNRAQTDPGPIGRVVTFMENNVNIQQVPYEKQKINNQAQKYAAEGKKLRLENGHHFVWYDCFRVLELAQELTVIVHNVVQDPERLDQEMTYMEADI